METIQTLLQTIEELKSGIIYLDSDPHVHYNEKYERLAEMRSQLVRTQAMCLMLLDDHLESLKREAA